MTDPLAIALEQTASGLYVPAQARTEVFPWEDLGAVNPPVGYTNIAHELIGTLAVLIAQGTSRPKLARCTDAGEIYTQSHVLPFTKLSAAITAPANTLSVLDSTPFRPGDTVVISPVVSGGSACSGVFITAIPDSHTIVVNNICAGPTFLPGDAITGTIPITVTQNLSTDVFGPLVLVAPGAPSPGDSRVGNTNTFAGHRRMMVDAERSYDWQNPAQNGNGVTVSSTAVAPGAGLRNIVALLVFGVSSNVAGEFGECELWQDAVGTGTKLLSFFLQIQPATNAAAIALTGLRFKGNVNQPVISRMVASSANANTSLTMAGYFEQ